MYILIFGYVSEDSIKKTKENFPKFSCLQLPIYCLYNVYACLFTVYTVYSCTMQIADKVAKNIVPKDGQCPVIMFMLSVCCPFTAYTHYNVYTYVMPASIMYILMFGYVSEEPSRSYKKNERKFS